MKEKGVEVEVLMYERELSLIQSLLFVLNVVQQRLFSL